MTTQPTNYEKYTASVWKLAGVVLVASIGVAAYWLGVQSVAQNDSEAASSTPRYLTEEEIVIIEPATINDEFELLPVLPVVFEYIEVIDSCDAQYVGDCVLVHAGPGTDFPEVNRLREGIVLKVDGSVKRDGVLWYKVLFDEWLRYPERVESDWYVVADYVDVLYDVGDKTTWDADYVSATSTKQIVIDLSEQTLTALENDEVYMCVDTSTGLAVTPTPRGTFTIFKKTPSRYMQGPLPGLSSDQYYDMPGVPWNLYFTHGGAVIHGAYWHNSFGSTYSHGCVNLLPEAAKQLYQWADLGTEVVVTE